MKELFSKGKSVAKQAYRKMTKGLKAANIGRGVAPNTVEKKRHTSTGGKANFALDQVKRGEGKYVPANTNTGVTKKPSKSKKNYPTVTSRNVGGGSAGRGGGGVYDISRPIKNAAKNYMKPEHLK